ncbi:MAG: hypothetical protein D6706_12495 [Chloroflexi bacterium]|nr:MAG: hypothetical protein D6706_12495 [Chloroflexota bacterium]
MSTKPLSATQFLKTLPAQVMPHLPAPMQKGIHVRQPWRWLIQFHFGEPFLHYEVSRALRREGWELGFHCESKDKQLNRLLLQGFRRHLFEIKDTLGDSIEAEMWDRGWTKLYEVYPPASLTAEYQAQVGRRLAEIICCVHPIFMDLRQTIMAVYR